jgi:hypothetical protein
MKNGAPVKSTLSPVAWRVESAESVKRAAISVSAVAGILAEAYRGARSFDRILADLRKMRSEVPPGKKLEIALFGESVFSELVEDEDVTNAQEVLKLARAADQPTVIERIRRIVG